MGGATGAASALLFISAVALAGPALVLRGATWASQRTILRSRAPSLLATVNARGYSRRLTAAVVPLALLVSLGTIQTGMNTVVTNAAQQQIAAAHAGDFIWEGDATGLGDVEAVLGSLPGVVATASTEVSVVHARVEDPGSIDPGGLTWEPSSLRVIYAESDLIEADVTDGDLAALTGRDTIAIASDALAFTFKGVGDTIAVRYPDGTETEPMIVAVYDHGMGLGGLITSREGFEPAAVAGTSPTVVIETAQGQQDAVRQAAQAAGLDLVTPQEYANAAADSGGDNQLGDTMLLALLGFIGIAAGNALVIATRARGNEFALLGRIGATKRQMWSMLAIEGALVAVGAVVIGTLMALPGLIAASLALVRGFHPVLDLTVYGGLALAATAIAFAGMAGARLKVTV